jgi:hypothetical protein
MTTEHRGEPLTSSPGRGTTPQRCALKLALQPDIREFDVEFSNCEDEMIDMRRRCAIL